jgi:hypothetical protein
VGHQCSGGTSYLFGERRQKGWVHYYLVCLAVKVPLTFWLLMACRTAVRPPQLKPDPLAPLGAVLLILIASVFSTRNYGIRYLLPAAPAAIV